MSEVMESLLNTYHDLNPSRIDELAEEPSPLEFMRYVAKNVPFIVRGAAREWPAMRKWNADYLKRQMDKLHVKVAITPHGNADSVVEDPETKVTYFVQPLEREMAFEDFIEELRNSGNGGGMVKYAQSQNDNLREEYATLLPDVPPDIAWARIALQRQPEAVNLWIGNSESTTSLHKDTYENVYCQVVGTKHFIVLSPIEVACVNEQLLAPAVYTPRTDTGNHVNGELILKPLDAEPVPWPTWDPDSKLRPSKYSHLSRPMRVDLNQGDILYLPKCWYHKVSQSSGDEGFCCSVNYWYDMDFDGFFFPAAAFVRETTRLSSDVNKNSTMV